MNSWRREEGLGKEIATGRAGTLLPLVADIPSQERPRMMRGHLPETLKEAYFNDEGIKKETDG